MVGRRLAVPATCARGGVARDRWVDAAPTVARAAVAVARRVACCVRVRRASGAVRIRRVGQRAQGRAQRAQKIADQLAQEGVEGMFEAALVHAGGRVDLLSRTHFARELVARKKATSVRTVFQDYLVAGKPGYVSHEWCSLAQAVGWITGAGGVAVFAHPGRCIHAHEGDELELLHEFVALGGRAIEVVTGSHSKNQYKKYTQIAQDFGLLASRGSDFHSSNESKMEAGKVPELPHGLIGVESLFG